MVTVLAKQGVYAKRLSVRLGVILPPIIGIMLFTQIPSYHKLLFFTPRAWLIGLMVIRVIGAAFLFAWASHEMSQSRFVLTAGCFDVFIGITALPVAWLVSSGSPTGLFVGVVWNILGCTSSDNLGVSSGRDFGFHRAILPSLLETRMLRRRTADILMFYGNPIQ